MKRFRLHRRKTSPRPPRRKSRNGRRHEPVAGACRERPIGLARLSVARDHRERRTCAADQGGRPRRHHVESLDLREGDRRDELLRRRHRAPRRQGRDLRQHDLRAAGHRRHRRRRRHAASALRRERRAAWLCQPGSVALPRHGYRGDDGGSAAAVGGGRARRTSSSRCPPRRREFPPSASFSPKASISTSRCCSRSMSTRRWWKLFSPASKTALRPVSRSSASPASRVFSSAASTPRSTSCWTKPRRARRDAAERAALERLRGKVAVANAKQAYQRWQRRFAGPRWERLKKLGARPQRLLWACTGTKNPAYSDVLYVDELIGPETVNTMPAKTMDAFRDHGRVRRLAHRGSRRGRANARRARSRRHLARRRHRRTRGRRRQAVFRFVRQAQRRARRQAPAHIGQGAERPGGRACANRSTRRSAGRRKPGARKEISAGCGAGMPRSGPGGTKATGWAGSTSSTRHRATSRLCRNSPAKCERKTSATRCFSAWADRASAPRCWRRAWDRRRASPSCTFSIPPIRKRSRVSSAGSIWRERFSSSRANPARRSSRMFSWIIFSTRHRSVLGRAGAARHFVAITDPGTQLEKTAKERGFAPRLPRRAEHRRTLFGAFPVRHGAAGGDGP